MDPRLVFDMICGVEIWRLKKPFQFYKVLLVQRMFLLCLTWSFLVVPFGRM
jgi:hypothetical protein